MKIRLVFRNLCFFILPIIFFMTCAGSRDDKPADWLEQQIASMSLGQKVGQMMVFGYTPNFFNESDRQFQKLVELIENCHVGGVIIWRGDPYAVARSIERLQSVSDVPLLVMADMEWGTPMRINEGTNFPINMAIGATGSEEYAYIMGKITAEEAKTAGVHVNFAPTMDVNNNPDNIIINTRSYGEDPSLVSRMGSAFIRGLQDNGVLATAKHYPGHGDTDVDSHLGLPTIDVDGDRLNRVELAPFRAAVEAGVRMVMVAHITYSAFPQMEGRPASLDSYFIQEVLREQIGFRGLVVTDAMGMGGIVNQYWSGEAAVMAINAGIDMVLVSPNFESTYRFVLQAAREGRISMDRVNTSVRRILEEKRRLGLSSTPKMDWVRFEEVFSKPAYQEKAEEIANASMTLVRDDKNIIPLKANLVDSVLVVAITDREWGYLYRDQLHREISQRIPSVKSALIDSRSSSEDIERIITEVDSSQAVVVGLFVTWGSYKGSVTLPDTTVSLVNKLIKRDKPMTIVSFGSPYLLRQIPEAPSYLCAYAADPLAIRAGVRAVFGEIPLTAKLPVTIPGLARMGDGLSRPKYDMQLDILPMEEKFQDAFQVLHEAIEDSVFPGAQICIVDDGKIVVSQGFGYQTYDKDSPDINTETLYDMASVTKVTVTTMVAMCLYDLGRLKLDIPVVSYLPEFSGGMKDSVTVRHLLTHSAGILWWDSLWQRANSQDEVLKYICDLPLVYAPGDSMVYSDLGIIMIGEILEVITGKTLDQLAIEMFFEPLGMENTMFNPPKELLPKIAPTEIGGSMNRGLIHGEVHDENAFFLGGVAAHAGLFSTSEDMFVFYQMDLNFGN